MNNANLLSNSELSNYQQWQMEQHGDILPEPTIFPDGGCENNEDEIFRSAQWVQLQEYIQLNQHENLYQ